MEKAQPGFQSQSRIGGGERRGDGRPTGRPIRGPSQPDSSLEEGHHRECLRGIQQLSGAEGQERRCPDSPPVPGDREAEGGWDFLAERSVNELGAAASVGGPGSPVVVRRPPMRPAGSEPVQPVPSAQRSLGQRLITDAGHGPAVSGDSLLRVEADESWGDWESM